MRKTSIFDEIIRDSQAARSMKTDLLDCINASYLGELHAFVANATGGTFGESRSALSNPALCPPSSAIVAEHGLDLDEVFSCSSFNCSSIPDCPGPNRTAMWRGALATDCYGQGLVHYKMGNYAVSTIGASLCF